MNQLAPLVGMSLAGIMTIALVLGADQTNAVVDGMRAVTAYAPASEQDLAATPSVPVLSGLIGLLDGVRELPPFSPPAPTVTDVSPAAAPLATAPAAVPGVQSPTPVPSPAAPTAGAAPTAVPTVGVTPLPTPTIPAAAAPATPLPAPSASPIAAPSATPAPARSVSTDRGAAAIVSLTGLVPGDTISRTITIRNTGTLGFKYAVSATQTASTALWTDTTQGLQLTVTTSGGTVLYSGPLSGLGSLSTATTMNPGDTELLGYTFAFPAAAPDSFQGLLQDLTLVFTATQYP